MTPVTGPVRITDTQRRARLVARHHLGRTAEHVVAATRGVVALHSTDPATPYLAARARVPHFDIADLDRALLEDRTLWRLHAMRRTLFIVPTADAAIVEAGASRDVAAEERRRVERWLGADMDPDDVPGFMAALEARVMDELADGRELRTGALAEATPGLGTEITLGSGKWTTRAPLSSRIVCLMAMDARLVRTRPAGSWRSSQYHWAATAAWFDGMPDPMDAGEARAELARRYLTAYGPATEGDLRWWTGWTAKKARAAVARLGVVPALLDDGAEAMLLPDDLEPGPSPTSHVALLPALDPTPMGWTGRDWFLGRCRERLFDRSGNIGPSVWVDGRIVGGWAQRPDGEVVYRLLEAVGAEANRRVAEAAASLTAWMAGTAVTPRFRTPLERELRGEDD